MTEAVEAVPGILVEYDAAIAMDDGLELRADVFRPAAEGRYPVILTHGPYGKNLHFSEGFAHMWERLSAGHPDALAGSSNRYQVWETVDPEKWVPDGYVCVRVDSRGAGRSPGYLDIFSARETRDFRDCIEWAGVQHWSNGKVGLLGISYYAMNQWQVAALAPPHLAAICPWEGAVDFYRDFNRHGGILNTFVTHWYPHQVATVQHGVGERGARDPNTGALVAGPETLSEEELAANRADSPGELLARPLDGAYHRERSGRPDLIRVPVLSAGNWAHPLHSRGNVEAFGQLPGPDAWLELHGLEHWTEFYTDRGVALQKRFFGHFLRGEDTGWEQQPKVLLHLREVDGSFTSRAEQEWPLARTEWTRLHLDLDEQRLDVEPAADGTCAFDATGPGVTFRTAPLTERTEITGPIAATLTVSSSTEDADLFLVLRVFDPDGDDVTFRSAVDPAGVVAFGWLRASHRRLDPGRSQPHRPYHTHDEIRPLTPSEPVTVEVEVWPTSVVIPAGYTLGLTILGRDLAFEGDGPWPEFNGVPMRGNGVFLHDHPDDRPPETFGGTTTLHVGPEGGCSILLPVIPNATRAPGGP